MQSKDPTQIEDAIHVEDLRVRRGGRDVLRGISLSVPRGAVTGPGPSGRGKTTLMRAIGGGRSSRTGPSGCSVCPRGPRSCGRA